MTTLECVSLLLDAPKLLVGCGLESVGKLRGLLNPHRLIRYKVAKLSKAANSISRLSPPCVANL